MERTQSVACIPKPVEHEGVDLMCHEEITIHEMQEQFEKARKTVSAMATEDDTCRPGSRPGSPDLLDAVETFTPTTSPVYGVEWKKKPDSPVEACTPSDVLPDFKPKVMIKSDGSWKQISLETSMQTPSLPTDVKVMKGAKALLGLGGKEWSRPCPKRSGYHPYKGPASPQKVKPSKTEAEDRVDDMKQDLFPEDINQDLKESRLVIKAQIDKYTDKNVQSLHDIKADIDAVWATEPSDKAKLLELYNSSNTSLHQIRYVFERHGADIKRVHAYGWSSILPLEDEQCLALDSKSTDVPTFRKTFDERYEQYHLMYKASQAYQGKYKDYKTHKTVTKLEFEDYHDLFDFQLNGKPVFPVYEYDLPKTKTPDYESNAKATMEVFGAMTRRTNATLLTDFKAKTVVNGFEMTYPMLSTYQGWVAELPNKDTEYGKTMHKWAEMSYQDLARQYFLHKSMVSVVEAKLLQFAAKGL